MLLRLACLLSLLPTLCLAGPWPRAKGTTFLSSSLELSMDETAPLLTLPNRVVPLRYTAGLYLEHGLTERLSLGATYSQNEMGRSDLSLFLGIGVLQRGKGTLSVELTAFEGGGAFALAYGRGLSIGKQGGWASVEARVGRIDADTEIKVDTTLGLSFNSGWKVMGQVFARQWEGDTSVIFAPSIAAPLGEKTHLQIGARISEDRDQPGIAIGLWREF